MAGRQSLAPVVGTPSAGSVLLAEKAEGSEIGTATVFRLGRQLGRPDDSAPERSGVALFTAAPAVFPPQRP